MATSGVVQQKEEARLPDTGFFSPGILKAKSVSQQPEAIMLIARFERRMQDYADLLHGRILQEIKDRGAIGELKMMLHLFWGLKNTRLEEQLINMIKDRGNTPNVVQIIWQNAAKPDAGRIAAIADPLQKCTGDLIQRMEGSPSKGKWEYELRTHATELKELSKMHEFLLEGSLVKFADYYAIKLAKKAGKNNVAAQLIIADAELQNIANSAVEIIKRY